jgi:ribosomal protein S18 acetylase RimI-like enzyme
MPISIRSATPSDAAALARFNAAFNGVTDPPEQIAARMLAAGVLETALLAEVDGTPAGFACVRVVPCLLYAAPAAELTELYVEPAFRRAGVARALIAAAEQLARERGADAMVIVTNLSNTPARALYHALGYGGDDLALHRRISGTA